MSAAATTWEFWIDRGGTFTDCIGVAPDGRLHIAKVLSSDTAPVEGIRALLEREADLAPGAPLPACRVKLGTTVATNALLERRGAPTALVTNRGLAGVFTIGTQERPELFNLNIQKPPPLHAQAVEIAGRTGADGTTTELLDEAATRQALRDARDAGCASVAIALIHAYLDPTLEEQVATWARDAGFDHIVASHEIAREIGLLARGETAAADAYLTPLLRGHIQHLEDALPGSHLRFMQSSGALTDAAHFRGPRALLSGPAGGVVATLRVAAEAGFAHAIGFDMGGTSTDVSLVHEDEVDRSFETRVGGVRVKAPMLSIHTVAAGGGSLCRFDGFRLLVGPESAGAKPGPLCYGRTDEAGRRLAREPALTDVNAFLGRIQPDHFPFPLDFEPVAAALEELRERLAKAGFARDPDALAAGFVEVANASMAEAIAQVSVSRGVDPRDHVLVGFGGAAGQHVCAVARRLGIRTVLLHPLAGLLSAYGIGVAELGFDGERDAGRVPLPEQGLPDAVTSALAELAAEGQGALAAEGASPDAITCEPWLDLRYAGTESALAVRAPEDGDWQAAFAREHQRRFGYTRAGRPVEIATARVRARAGDATPSAAESPAAPSADPTPLRHEHVWFPDAGRVDAPVYERHALQPGHTLAGPALILEEAGTVVLDAGFRLHVEAGGRLRLQDEGAAAHARPRAAADDPVRLEVVGNRCMSIAEQMGAVLRN
ncbi:MAG: 5-oxoprolinase, partial [Proteobacteria bacterium]|nr:5-oxoprolinase [Pseudomonadota bacterium]